MTCHLFLGRPGHGRDLFVKSKYQTPPSLTAGAVKLTSKPPFYFTPFLSTTFHNNKWPSGGTRGAEEVSESAEKCFLFFFESPLKNNNSEYANKQRHSWKKKREKVPVSKRAEIRRRKCVCVHATRLQIILWAQKSKTKMEVPETHFVYTSQVQGSLVLNKKLRNYFIYGILPPAISLSLSLSLRWFSECSHCD